MPVEIIGDDDGVKKQVTCRNCGKVLRYLPIDVTTKIHYDYGGGSDPYSFINCPHCKAAVMLKS